MESDSFFWFVLLSFSELIDKVSQSATQLFYREMTLSKCVYPMGTLYREGAEKRSSKIKKTVAKLCSATCILLIWHFVIITSYWYYAIKWYLE